MQALRWFSNATVALAATVTLACAEDQMPWQPNLETARQIAAQTNRLVLIHFWAPWCKACVPLDKDVFSRAETGRALESNYVLVKLNYDEAPGTARMYGVSSLPTDVIIAPNGRLVSQVQSPPTPSQYVTQMNQAAAGYRELTRNPAQAVAAVGAQTSAVSTAPGGAPIPTSAQPSSGPVTITPVNATAPIATASAAPAAPPAGAPQTAAQQTPAQSAAPDDRYADYYRQRANAAAAADAAPVQSTGPPAYAPTGAPQASAAPPAYAQTTAPQASAAPPAAVGAGSPQTAPAAQTPAYATPGQNQPAYAAPPAYQPQPPAYQPQPPAYQPQPQAPPVQPQPSQPQLPPGCPPLGLYGYCPVSLVESKQWILGDKTWGVVHRGRTYLFIGPAEKEKFLANPDRYSPVLSGLDPVLFLDNQVTVPGRREIGVFGTDGRIYLFADEASLKRFDQNPKRYSAEAIQAMR